MATKTTAPAVSDAVKSTCVQLASVFARTEDRHGVPMRVGKTAEYIEERDGTPVLVTGHLVTCYTESIFDSFKEGLWVDKSNLS